MKILNRPMFRMGGPIKEGIMNNIKEPRQGYKQSGMVFPRDIKRMMPDAAKVFADVGNQYTNTFAGDKINYNPYINKNRTDGKEFLRHEGEEPIFKESIDINNDGVVTMKEKYMDSYENQKRISDLTNKKNREIIEPFLTKPNTTDKFLPSRQGDYLNPDYIDPSKVVESYDGSTDKMPPMLDKTGKTGAIDEVIEKKEVIEENPEANRKKSINNILEKLGYARSQKNALYDALIKGGQRIAREGLGKEGLVADLIADTSTSYDKPEKIREAAELMQVQQDLKLEGIRESKTGGQIQQSYDFFRSQNYSKADSLKKAQGLATDLLEAKEIGIQKNKLTGDKLTEYVAQSLVRMNNDSFKNNEYLGTINSKDHDTVSDFAQSTDFNGAGVYSIKGKVIEVDDNGTILSEQIVTSTSSDKKWWKRSE